ncbi:MAG: Flp pilus assembly complex ATPase component TadA [Deltaproteobacteria bacterium]|nr:Flp pilus assembly complex ATPase component TadA [Deltaproteobacteria bacterium]
MHTPTPEFTAAQSAEIEARLEAVLRFAAARGIADVQFKPTQRPLYRRFGQLISRRDEPVFSADDLLVLAHRWLPAAQRATYERQGDATFVVTLVGCGRFRVTFLQSRGAPALSVRVIPPRILNLRELNLPRVLGNWAMLPHGLVLVSSPPGAGKSSTLAAMVEHVNTASTAARQVVTLEMPLEQQFDDKVAYICQREIGVDTADLHSGLRTAMRQAPDVVAVDAGSAQDLAALVEAAELDLLVVATVTGGGAVDVVRRLLDAAGDRRAILRQRLARRLRGVVHQQLAPTADGKGMTPVCEVLHLVPQAAELLRSDRDIEGLQALIDNPSHRGVGMIGFDQALIDLVQTAALSADSALATARDPDTLRPKLANLRPAVAPPPSAALPGPGPGFAPATAVAFALPGDSERS